MPAYPLGLRRNRLPDWRIRFGGPPREQAGPNKGSPVSE